MHRSMYKLVYVTVAGCILVLAVIVTQVKSRDVNVASFEKPWFDPNKINNRPIIGILAQETDGWKKKHGETYFYAAYVKFVEGGGARAAPIKVGQPESYYHDLLGKLNGVVIPGGGNNPLTSNFAHIVKFIVRYAIKANDAGEYFPVLAICLGFESLVLSFIDKNVMRPVDAEKYVVPLNFLPGYSHSRLYGNLSPKLLHILTHENSTANAHHWSISPQTFAKYPNLPNFFHILSTNKDRDGVEFVSSIEAYRYPIYGTQFHPEKNTYLWDPIYPWDHSYHGVLVTQHFGNFIVNEARKSLHTFGSLQAEYDNVIDRHTPVILGVHEYPFEEMYVFKLGPHDVRLS